MIGASSASRPVINTERRNVASLPSLEAHNGRLLCASLAPKGGDDTADAVDAD